MSTKIELSTQAQIHGNLDLNSKRLTNAQDPVDAQDYTTKASIATLAPAETAATIGTLTHGATTMTTPGNADEIGVADSTASWVIRRLSWSDLKAALKTYLDTLYQPLASLLTAIVALASTGLIARTGSGTAAARTITGTSNQITVADGDGVSGNPTISLPSTLVLPSGTAGTTQAAGDNSTALATTAYVDTAVAAGGATAVGATKGGTGLTSCALGDLLYASGANTWASLAANSSATRKFLRSVSSGAPAWDTLQAGDIPDLSATYALAGLASIFTGSGNTSTYQQTTSTSWVRLNSQLSGVDGVTWTNSSGRTQQVLVLITCSVSSDGLHASYFRVGCSGSGVTATLQGSFRTPVSNYVPATLAAVVSVTSGSTATLYVQASVSGGGTAYLHEGGDSTWTLIGIPIG